MLPGSLGEALAALQSDDLMRETLGDHILDRFVEAKTAEWQGYVTHVTAWELERYLSVY
jgi:glutamine synthetase